MRRLFTVLSVFLATAPTFAQGLVNFFNTPTTLVSVNYEVIITGVPQSYYFGLLTSPVGANTFTFSGIYGTNTGVAGLFSGGTGVVVDGWAPGAARDFQVVGWGYIMGHDYDPAWINGPWHVGQTIDFGVSEIGTGVAGGVTSSGTLASLDIFGGATGIQGGFNITRGALVPEPGSLSLAVLGAGFLVVFRFRLSRRTSPNAADPR